MQFFFLTPIALIGAEKKDYSSKSKGLNIMFRLKRVFQFFKFNYNVLKTNVNSIESYLCVKHTNITTKAFFSKNRSLIK